MFTYTIYVWNLSLTGDLHSISNSAFSPRTSKTNPLLFMHFMHSKTLNFIKSGLIHIRTVKAWFTWLPFNCKRFCALLNFPALSWCHERRSMSPGVVFGTFQNNATFQVTNGSSEKSISQTIKCLHKIVCTWMEVLWIML